MKITLSQDEITSAVITYVNSIITLSSSMDITCDFSSGRGTGISAEINIVPAEANAEEKKTVNMLESETIPFVEVENSSESTNNTVRSLFGNLS